MFIQTLSQNNKKGLHSTTVDTSTNRLCNLCLYLPHPKLINKTDKTLSWQCIWLQVKQSITRSNNTIHCAWSRRITMQSRSQSSVRWTRLWCMWNFPQLQPTTSYVFHSLGYRDFKSGLFSSNGRFRALKWYLCRQVIRIQGIYHNRWTRYCQCQAMLENGNRLTMISQNWYTYWYHDKRTTNLHTIF